MPGKYDTVQLVQDIKENKQGALDRLLRVYGRAIYGFVRSRNLLSDSDSEDIYQDTIIDIWKGIGAYEPDKGTLLGFLLKIAENSLAAYCKMYASEGEGSENDGYVYNTDIDGDDSFVSRTNGETGPKDDSGDEDRSGDKPEADKNPEEDDRIMDKFISKVAQDVRHSGIIKGQGVLEILPELKGTPDWFVLNSPYLFEKYELLLRALMGEAGPVQHALVYAVTQLSSGAAENIKGLEIDDLMDKTLFELLLIFRRGYSQYSGIPDSNMDEEIMLMLNRLNELEDGRKLGSMKLEELIAADEKADISGLKASVRWKIHEYINENFLEVFEI